jgi:hypothetical protein
MFVLCDGTSRRANGAPLSFTYLRQLLLCFVPLIQQSGEAGAAANRLLQDRPGSAETQLAAYQWNLQEI